MKLNEKKSILALSFLTFLFVCSSSFAAMEQLSVQDLDGIVPSFMVDLSGFDTGEPQVDLSEAMELPVVPLLPIYKSGALGKNNYVGGVVEEKYLAQLSRQEVALLKQKIRSSVGPNGIPLRPVDYDGKLYAVRGDYNLSYQHSTTVGFSLSFGGGGDGNTLVLGDAKTIGFSLDFGSTTRIGKTSGLNVGGALQSVIDDWSTALKPDETKYIVSQAAAITPLLMSYLAPKKDPLLDESGSPLTLLKAKKNDGQVSARVVELTAGSHTSEWEKIKKDLSKNIAKEVAFHHDIQDQVRSQKVINQRSNEELIQKICDRLASSYDVPTDVWPKCRIAATLTPNAWAYPGGDIFITAGLLGILSEIDSVELVLGHEIGHVMARHSSKKVKTAKTANYAASFVSTVLNLGLTAFSAGGGLGYLGQVTLLSWFPQVMASSVAGSYMVGKGFELAMLAPAASLMLQSREFESQADRLGQEAAYTTGSDLTRMNSGWQEFIDYFEKYFPQETNLKQKVMADHPDSKSRLGNFEDRAQKLESLLKTTNEQNQISQDDREAYQRLHHSFKPYADSFGRDLRKQLEDLKGKKRLSLRHRKAQHILQTMTGPHLLCLEHALGAH